MFGHKQTPQQIALAEKMRLALENEHKYPTPMPNSLSQFRKETLLIPTGE